MRTQRNFIIAALVLGVAVILAAAPASAQASKGMTICNQSSYPLATAIGYHSPGVNDPADHSLLTGPFVTRGWLRIEPGACHTFENPFNARYMYWYGWTYPDHNTLTKPVTGEATSASVAMTNPLAWCVKAYLDDPSAFTYEVENTKSNDASNITNNCNFKGDKMTGWWVFFDLVDTWVDSKASFTGQ